jgi:uncharacterized membrane protein YfcA
MGTEPLIGAVLAFAIATVTTPVGVSGAVFLIPVQLSILHTPSPAITPTNLLYNLIAIPGALLRYRRQGPLWSPLTRALVLGALPGVIAGAVIRVELLSAPEAFLFVVSLVLASLGVWLLLLPPAPPRAHGGRVGPGITALAGATGVVGGIYGIGGGSILAPILVGLGFGVAEVAPAALTATFLTSAAGVLSFAVLGLGGDGDIAPDWLLGISIGIGGLAGSYLGARLQPRLPEAGLRGLLGLLALALAAGYLLRAIL